MKWTDSILVVGRVAAVTPTGDAVLGWRCRELMGPGVLEGRGATNSWGYRTRCGARKAAKRLSMPTPRSQRSIVREEPREPNASEHDDQHDASDDEPVDRHEQEDQFLRRRFVTSEGYVYVDP